MEWVCPLRTPLAGQAHPDSAGRPRCSLGTHQPHCEPHRQAHAAVDDAEPHHQHPPTHPHARTHARTPRLQVVRRIDVTARSVYWSEGGSLVAIASDASFYLLEYQRDLAESALASGQVRRRCPAPGARAREVLVAACARLLAPSRDGCRRGSGHAAAPARPAWPASRLTGNARGNLPRAQEVDEDGIEDAFELTSEIPEKIRTGIWVSPCRPCRPRWRAGDAPPAARQPCTLGGLHGLLARCCNTVEAMLLASELGSSLCLLVCGALCA